MPATPFHFGPAILIKACAPRAVSLTAFALSQVLIDIESGYHLFRAWPLHREMHSLVVAGLARSGSSLSRRPLKGSIVRTP